VTGSHFSGPVPALPLQPVAQLASPHPVYRVPYTPLKLKGPHAKKKGPPANAPSSSQRPSTLPARSSALLSSGPAVPSEHEVCKQASANAPVASSSQPAPTLPLPSGPAVPTEPEVSDEEYGPCGLKIKINLREHVAK
jgi:hypothetical protein